MYVHCLKNVAFEIGLEVKGGMNTNIYFFFLRFYLFIFREKGREEEREGENHQCVVVSHVSPPGGPGLPGMCPDWESNG